MLATIDQRSDTGQSAMDLDPMVYVVGESARANDVENCLQSVSLHTIRLKNVGDLKTVRDPSVGVVLVAPLVGMEHAIESLKRKKSAGNIHVVTTNSCSPGQAERFYKLGASTVTAFPRERRIFGDLVLDLEEEGPRIRAENDAERRMVRAIWSRAKTALDSMKQVQIWMLDGVVHLMGQVPTESSRNDLENTVARAPGVRGIVDGGLTLRSREARDRAIENRINEEIDRVPGLSNATLLCTVKGSVAKIAGTVESKANFHAVKRVMRRQRDVVKVVNLVSISRSNWIRSHGTARAIRRKMEHVFLRSEVRVTVFGKVAVLRGWVSHERIGRQISRMVLRDPDINHVIDKMQVGSH